MVVVVVVEEEEKEVVVCVVWCGVWCVVAVGWQTCCVNAKWKGRFNT